MTQLMLDMQLDAVPASFSAAMVVDPPAGPPEMHVHGADGQTVAVQLTQERCVSLAVDLLAAARRRLFAPRFGS